MTLTRSRLAIAGAVLAVAALVLAGAWYLLLRGEAEPPPVSLAGAVAGIATATPGGASTPAPAAPATTPTAAAAASATPGARGSSSGDLTGTWSVVSGSDSFVGYRVREQLASIGAQTAVGRTSSVKGELEFDGKAITRVEIEADMRSLRSDDSRRDNALGRQSLETSRFPTATFKLTQPIPLPKVPAEGETIEATAQGRLMLHGVTRDVMIPLKGQLAGGRVVVIGSLEIVFADYGIEQPRAILVLSVEDRGVMEFQLVFERAV